MRTPRRTSGRTDTLTPPMTAGPVLRRVIVAAGIVLFTLIFLPFAAVAGLRSPAPPDTQVQLVLFHGDGCPHCDRAEAFLDGLEDRWPALVVERYEVWNDAANRQRFIDALAALGQEPRAVPTIVAGDRIWVGFSDATGEEIEMVIGALITGSPVPDNAEDSTVIEIPLFGDVDVGGRSLILATVLIGFVDGVNPCSLWVLSVLLALVLHSGSRARVIVVGSVFLLITSALYGLYMAGAYSVLDYADDLAWIRAGVAAVAGIFGILHLKEYFTHRGVSVTISDRSKPKMYQRMRALAHADRSLPAVLGGTAVLAVGVSLVETPCTAGLPLLWTDMLAARDVSGSGAVLLFSLYIAMFLLDEVILFGAAVVTLRATKLQEEHGKALQLVSGTVMVALAATMLLRPTLLESLSGTVVVFGLAAAVAAVVLAVGHRHELRIGRRV